MTDDPVVPRAGLCAACSSVDIAGHEVRGVYDGVLYWQCLACGWVWHTWPRDHPRARIAQSYVDAIRAAREIEGHE